MPISLYDATVPTFLQVLGSVEGLLDKAEAFCAEKGMQPEEMLEKRLIEDMLPFAYQVKSVAFHSFGAIEAVRSGTVSPDMAPPPQTFAGLRDKLGWARQGLSQVTAEEMETLIGGNVHFSIPGRLELNFTAENFLLTFSQPNFHFHAMTTYNLLRQMGANIGKRDYLGAMRMITPA